jgi:hypothetical protein
MARSFVGSLLAIAIVASIAHCGEPVFKHVIPTDSINFARVFSEDSRAATLMFDNFVVATEIGQASLPSVSTKKFSYVLQIDNDKETCVVQHIRGFVSTQGSGSAALMIQSAGKTITVELDKAIEAAKKGAKKRDGERLRKLQKVAADEGFTADERPVRSDDFFVEVKSTVPAGKPLQTTCLLLVDRLTGDDGSGALLTIGTIDFEINAPKSSK